MSEPITLLQPTKYRCPKCKTEILITGIWSVMDISFELGQKQRFSTGPICPSCTVEFIKANVPVMEVVNEPEGTKTASSQSEPRV